MTPIRYGFYLFLASMPFETVNLGISDETITLAKIIGYAFVALSLLQPRLWRLLPPQSFWWFLAYFLCVVLLGIGQPAYYHAGIWTQVFNRLQMLVLFWISASMFRDMRVRKGALISFSAGCGLLAIMQVIGVKGISYVLDEFRVSTLRANANEYGWLLGIALLSLASLAFGEKPKVRIRQFFFWIIGGLLILFLVRTGSRSAMVAFVAGLAALLLGRRSGRTWLRNALVVSVITCGLIAVVLGSLNVRSRWERVLYSSDFSERQLILPAAFNMAREKPILGWGPYVHRLELANRLIRYGTLEVDPHSTYLWVLTETGLIGGIPFLVGIGIGFANAWRMRTLRPVALSLSLMVSLITMGIAGSILYMKLFWIILAYVGSEYQESRGVRVVNARMTSLVSGNAN